VPAGLEVLAGARVVAQSPGVKGAQQGLLREVLVPAAAGENVEVSVDETGLEKNHNSVFKY